MIIDTNLNGIFNMSKLVIPHMLKEGWGRVINISTSLMTMQRKGYSPYGSTKWAVEGLTCILAQDLEETRITANILISILGNLSFNNLAHAYVVLPNVNTSSIIVIFFVDNILFFKSID